MSMCEPCAKLRRALSSVEPHRDLVLLGIESYNSDGFRRAHSQRYRCMACSTEWERDMDQHDKLAQWDLAL